MTPPWLRTGASVTNHVAGGSCHGQIGNDKSDEGVTNPRHPIKVQWECKSTVE